MTDIEEIVQEVEFTEDEYAEYTHTFTYIVKKVWISLQVIMMTTFMIRGLIYYYRTLNKFWDKTRMLLIFQGCQFLYLIVNEFVWHNMTGIYVNLLLCSYGHFLTFCIVQDSCLSEQDHQGRSPIHVVNVAGRVFFHTFFVVLLCCVYFAGSCEEHLYPPVFLLCGLFIATQQIFDLTLYWVDYLIKWEELPPQHISKLYYNEELFHKQTRVLFWSNILFGAFAILTMIFGFTFVNSNAEDPDQAAYIVCYHGNQWIEKSLWGSLFLMCHQILILLQINASQYVLVRIPHGLGIFKEKSVFERVGDGIRSGLLSKSITHKLDTFVDINNDSTMIKEQENEDDDAGEDKPYDSMKNFKDTIARL